MFLLNKKNLIVAFLISAVSIFVIYQLVMNVEALYNIIGYRIRNLILFANNQQADENSIYVRQDLIEKGIEWFKERPIFGHGIGTFSYLNDDGYYAHNGYIELLVGMGLVGTIVFFMPIISALRASIKNRIFKKSFYVSFMMILILVVAYSSVISYSPHYSIVVCVYFVIINKNKEGNNFGRKEIIS